MRKSRAQDVWQLAKDKDGIKVYVSEITSSDYFAFKATMSVKTTEKEIVKMLKDVNKYTEWFAFTASTRLLSQSDNDQSFFLETDYPWPFSNECKNYRMVFEKKQGNSLRISITGIDSPVKCNYFLKKANGYILLKTESEYIQITYFFHCEPSQRIPPWLINPKIHDMPFQTFKALRKKIMTELP